MRLVLRFSMLLVVAGLASSQAITDAAAVIAGSSVGAGAGKQVSEGISSVLNKVDVTTAKAAKTEKVARTEKPADREVRTKAGEAGEKRQQWLEGKAVEPCCRSGPGGVVKDHSLVPPPPARKVAVVPPPPPMAPPTAAVLTLRYPCCLRHRRPRLKISSTACQRDFQRGCPEARGPCLAHHHV